MTEFVEFNERDWLREYYQGAGVPLEQLENIKHFVFFWSLFEKKMCNNRANARSLCDCIDKLASNKQLEKDDFLHILSYFKTRYLSNGKVNNTFEKLTFRTPDKKEFVKEVLEKEDSSLDETLKAVLIIIYRLRNNLFHGKKRVELLSTQIENFKITNAFLAKLIEKKD